MITIEEIRSVANQGPFYPNWKSLSNFRVPAWFDQAKFGIFIHWGVYSVPAFGSEWYPRNMYIQGSEEFKHHIKTYGEHVQFGYKDFIPHFTAPNFDSSIWLDLVERSGAQYLIPVAEHHDGFQLYKSELSCFNSVEMGPRQDIIGLLKKEASHRRFPLGVSTHRAEHYFFFGHGREFKSDIGKDLNKGDLYWPAMSEPDHFDLHSHPGPSKEFLDDWLLRTCELIRDYQPEILYFDWWIQHEAFKEYLQLIAAYYYNLGCEWGKSTAIAYKHDALAFGTGIVEVERGGFEYATSFKWQTDTSIARNSWSYTDNLDYKSSKEIIQTLIDVVSKNGNLLLNIGPKADGSISETDQMILKEIGDWMNINGEAIYGSRVWRVSEEGSTKVRGGQFLDSHAIKYQTNDFRFTCRGEAIYIMVMADCHPSQTLCVKSLSDSPNPNSPHFYGIIDEVNLLGSTEKMEWYKNLEGLHLKLPDKLSLQPLVFKVVVK